jgi:fused signal recognition particle receptor
VGVNGVGKTTSIGKLAWRFKSEGKKVLMAAGDTFRAAAESQLEIWAQRAGVDIVRLADGADPGAVVFQALAKAREEKYDVVIIDTAGRLHNKTNLMAELKKIRNVVDKQKGEAAVESLLVLDASTGQNGLQQAKVFSETCGLTGVILTKLDGTAKGGVVFAIARELKIPVKLIGIGEKIEDLRDFDPNMFVEALF